MATPHSSPKAVYNAGTPPIRARIAHPPPITRPTSNPAPTPATPPTRPRDHRSPLVHKAHANPFYVVDAPTHTRHNYMHQQADARFPFRFGESSPDLTRSTIGGPGNLLRLSHFGQPGMRRTPDHWCIQSDTDIQTNYNTRLPRRILHPDLMLYPSRVDHENSTPQMVNLPG